MTDITQTLAAYSSLVHATATIVLVLINIYYIRQSKVANEELAQTRKSEYAPLLSLRMEARDPHTIDVYLSNIGRGLAQYPKVSLPFVQPQEVGEHIVADQENVLVTLTDVGTVEILELPEEERLLTVEYGDIFGRTIITKGFLRSEESETGEIEKQLLALEDWEIVLPNAR